MTVTSMVLTDPARGLSYQLLPNDSVRVADFEVTAAVRAVSEDWANADGSSDTTKWVSSAAVTIDLAAVGAAGGDSIGQVLDKIGGLCLPWARPWLVVTDTEWPAPRQIQLRFDSHSHQYELDTIRQVQLSFKGPRGLWEDTTLQIFDIGADVPDSTGLVFTSASGTLAHSATGYVFPASTGQSPSVIGISGNARPRWTAKLYGPATGPKLTRADTGQSVNFTDGLTLGAGQYLQIDPQARSALLGNDPDASRLANLDFATSEWFPLDPGQANRLRYHASSGTTGGTIAVITVNPVWFP